MSNEWPRLAQAGERVARIAPEIRAARMARTQRGQSGWSRQIGNRERSSATASSTMSNPIELKYQWLLIVGPSYVAAVTRGFSRGALLRHVSSCPIVLAARGI